MKISNIDQPKEPKTEKAPDAKNDKPYIGKLLDEFTASLKKESNQLRIYLQDIM